MKRKKKEKKKKGAEAIQDRYFLLTNELNKVYKQYQVDKILSNNLGTREMHNVNGMLFTIVSIHDSTLFFYIIFPKTFIKYVGKFFSQFHEIFNLPRCWLFAIKKIFIY